LPCLVTALPERHGPKEEYLLAVAALMEMKALIRDQRLWIEACEGKKEAMAFNTNGTKRKATQF
jgi:hypothetical protein